MQMMETKDILFTGIGRAVSDIDIPDGELSISHNIIRDNGSMRPIWVPDAEIVMGEGERLVYVHRMSGKKHYIVLDGQDLKFFTEEKAEREFMLTLTDTDIKVSSIGKTLMITSEGEGLRYVLFKEDKYKLLGNKPPELDINWRLQLSRFSKMTDTIKVSKNTGITDIDEEYRQIASEKLSAEINKLIAEAEEDNNFTGTFFVRWAYRLYDGLYMVSPPVMMPLNAGMFPNLTVFTESGESYYVPGTDPLTKFKVKIDGFKGKLEYEIPFFSTKQAALEDWSDIITGVEIYVTRSVTSYNQDGIVKGIVEGDGKERCISLGWMRDVSSSSEYYGRRAYHIGALYQIDGMNRTMEEYVDELTQQGVFYKLKGYSLDELESGAVVEPDGSELLNIATSSVLSKQTDEYLQHDVLYPKGVTLYNSRVNLFGVKAQKYNFPVYALAAFTNGYTQASVRTLADTEDGGNVEDEDTSLGEDTLKSYQYNIRFVISNDGESVNVTRLYETYKMYEPPMFLFYPDNSATEAIIERIVDGVYQQARVKLKSHQTLQGCYWFGGFEPLEFIEVTADKYLSEGGETRMVNYGGKVYTSEVNNPFVFPLAGINTVGVGEIRGIASITKALSQGQFGQFPMYVFSTDGVWAMEVGSDGLYKAIKPISRDVCINGDSITQTDNAVLFVTEKGVMMIDGSQVNCISEMMNGRSFDVDSVAMLPEVMVKEGVSSGLNGINDFMDYARKGKMVYDYPNGRILLYAEGMDYVYVFSLGSSTWATLGINIDGSVTDYPDAYIQTGNEVRNLSERIDYNSTYEVNTLIVTRPIKLGSDEYKTVYEMVARGTFNKCGDALLLWGSQDGDNYTLIADSCGNRIYRMGGTAYRYFRIGVVGNMAVGSTLSMVSMRFRRKYGNRLR